jgi:uncharacterized protein with HEPN domain
LPSENPIHRFEDILDNIKRIERYTRSLTFAQFEGDEQCRDAVEHCLLRISEAAKKLEGVADGLLPTLPWRSIRAIGNVLRHQYDDVDPGTIWEIVTNELSPLRDGVVVTIEKLKAESVRPSES